MCSLKLADACPGGGLQGVVPHAYAASPEGLPLVHRSVRWATGYARQGARPKSQARRRALPGAPDAGGGGHADGGAIRGGGRNGRRGRRGGRGGARRGRAGRAGRAARGGAGRGRPGARGARAAGGPARARQDAAVRAPATRGARCENTRAHVPRATGRRRRSSWKRGAADAADMLRNMLAVSSCTHN